MAEVAMPARLHRHTGSISQIETGALLRSAPTIEMMPNPEFSFPALPASGGPGGLHLSNSRGHRRPQSMHAGLQASTVPTIAHRRHGSALPTFTFNATETTGLKDASTPPLTPLEHAPQTPSSTHRGHRRRGSEFVGGDSRLGVQGAITCSPTKLDPPMLPVPSSVRRHQHRRSGANSHHDLSGIMLPTAAPEVTRKSSSLPTTPLAHDENPPTIDRTTTAPAQSSLSTDFFGPVLESSDAKPVARPRVGFSDNIEFIPRPLSTISSDTEGSASTRGHSLNNSISSVLSLSSPSPPSKRPSRQSLTTTFEDEPQPRARSSTEISKRVEKEGEWLMSRSNRTLKRPLSEPRLPFTTLEPSNKQKNAYPKKHSFSYTLGFDRRKSEPAILLASSEATRLATVKLDSSQTRMSPTLDAVNAQSLERRPSSKGIRSWALSKLSKKAKDRSDTSLQTSEAVFFPAGGQHDAPGRVPMPHVPAAETDLDAVLGGDVQSSDLEMVSQPRIEVISDRPVLKTGAFHEVDDESAIVDLDAALGPMMTPPLSSQKPRRELHSSRGTKDFSGLGMHYHRRAESAPELPPFSRTSMVSQSSLPDVFENDDEEEGQDDYSNRPTSSASSNAGTGIGVHVVDSADQPSESAWSDYSGLRIRSSEWETERPSTSYGSAGSRLSTPGAERRPSSIVAETIFEETTPADAIQAVEIVPAEDEPRASSVTKSSDSSETSTLLASQSGALTVPDSGYGLMTPDTFQTSTFSSPDLYRRKGSSDTSRVGTAASSITDNRTMSSYAGDHPHRVSVDDTPSLTSSRSTMLSSMHPNTSHRDLSADQPSPLASEGVEPRVMTAERRRKRASIQSLSQLVGGSFSSKSKVAAAVGSRPHTAVEPSIVSSSKTPKREHRLKKFMFWRSKSKQSLRHFAAED